MIRSRNNSTPTIHHRGCTPEDKVGQLNGVNLVRSSCRLATSGLSLYQDARQQIARGDENLIFTDWLAPISDLRVARQLLRNYLFSMHMQTNYHYLLSGISGHTGPLALED